MRTSERANHANAAIAASLVQPRAGVQQRLDVAASNQILQKRE